MAARARDRRDVRPGPAVRGARAAAGRRARRGGAAAARARARVRARVAARARGPHAVGLDRADRGRGAARSSRAPAGRRALRRESAAAPGAGAAGAAGGGGALSLVAGDFFARGDERGAGEIAGGPGRAADLVFRRSCARSTRTARARKARAGRPSRPARARTSSSRARPDGGPSARTLVMAARRALAGPPYALSVDAPRAARPVGSTVTSRTGRSARTSRTTDGRRLPPLPCGGGTSNSVIRKPNPNK